MINIHRQLARLTFAAVLVASTALQSPTALADEQVSADAIVVVTGQIDAKSANDALARAARAGQIWLVDAAGALRAVVKDASEAQRAQTLRSLAPGVLARPVSPDLPATLDAVGDLVSLARPGRVDVLLLGPIAHRDVVHDFAQGYPNDGFVALEDSSFRHLRKSSRPWSLTVIHPAGLRFARDYQRWMDLLLRTRVDATLARFAPDTDPSLTLQGDAAVADATVTRSLVISTVASTTPSGCPVSAVPLAWTPAEERDLIVELDSVPDRCLIGASAELRVNGEVRHVPADDRGRIRVRHRLRVGENVIALVTGGGSGADRVLYHRAVEPRTDIITVGQGSGVGDGVISVARISAENPLRDPGDLVLIEHVESGRRYEARVDAQGRYEANVSIYRRGTFRISQLAPLPPQVIDIGPPACDDVVTADVVNGTAVVALVNPCRSGKPVTFEYAQASLERGFDPGGRADAKIPLDPKRDTHDIIFTRDDGTGRLITLKWSPPPDLVRVTLRWQASIDLDLHVFEGDVPFNGQGHTYFARMKGGVGELDIDDLGDRPGVHTENFVADLRNLPSRELTILVDHFSRWQRTGERAIRPFCGGGPADAVPFTVEVLIGGRVVEQRSMATPSVSCGDAARDPLRRLTRVHVLTLAPMAGQH